MGIRHFLLSLRSCPFVRRASLSPTGIRFWYLWHATWHREAFCTYIPAFGLGVHMGGDQVAISVMSIKSIRSDQIIIDESLHFFFFIYHTPGPLGPLGQLMVDD